MRDNPKVVRAEFSFLSLAVLVGMALSVHVMHREFYSAENLAQPANIY